MRGADAAHLQAAISWLCRAHDAGGGGGVSAEYRLVGGWNPPYPETSGYIVPTFLDHARNTGDASLVERAQRICGWEISIQLPTGAVRGGQGINDYPIVFNTGQVMIGWNAMVRENGDERCLEASKRAGDWLCEVQAKDGPVAGSWTQHTLHEEPHAYHTRVAWPVLELARITGDEKYLDCGARFVEWVLSGCHDDGWIDYMAFKVGDPALTHTIAYTARGLLECAECLRDARPELAERAVAGARGIAERLFHAYERSKRGPTADPRPLPGTYAEGWRPVATSWTCLTGNCQLAIIWLMLQRLDGDPRWMNTALKTMDQNKAAQSLTSTEPGIRGAIAGSFPIWGKYIQLSYPNWATKFFADALMLQEQTVSAMEA